MLYLFWVWNQNGVVRILVIFKIGLCSAISFKRSWRELSIDVAEHGSMLKNDRYPLYPRVSFIRKTGIAFPRRGFVFTVWPNFKEIYDDFSRIMTNICWIYLNISQISVNSGLRVKKITENSHVSTESNSRISRRSTRYQPDIKTFRTPDITRCHPSGKVGQESLV